MVEEKYQIFLSKQALKDFDKIKLAGLAPKIKALLDILRSDPFQNYPPYEALVGNLRGFYSRRINIKHRLVYEVDRKKHTVKILRMWTHYE